MVQPVWNYQPSVRNPIGYRGNQQVTISGGVIRTAACLGVAGSTFAGVAYPPCPCQTYVCASVVFPDRRRIGTSSSAGLPTVRISGAAGLVDSTRRCHGSSILNQPPPSSTTVFAETGLKNSCLTGCSALIVCRRFKEAKSSLETGVGGSSIRSFPNR